MLSLPEMSNDRLPRTTSLGFDVLPESLCCWQKWNSRSYYPLKPFIYTGQTPSYAIRNFKLLRRQNSLCENRKIVYTRPKYNLLENWFWTLILSVTVTSEKNFYFSCLRHSSNRNKHFLCTISQQRKNLELNLPCCQARWALGGHGDCFCPSLTAPAFRLSNVLLPWFSCLD